MHRGPCRTLWTLVKVALHYYITIAGWMVTITDTWDRVGTYMSERKYE